MPSAIYNAGEHAIVPMELRHLNIEIISPVFEGDDFYTQYVHTLHNDDFNIMLDFYGGWEHNNTFGALNRTHNILVDPDGDWNGFWLKKQGIEKWFPIWSNQVVFKIKSFLRDEGSGNDLLFHDGSTMKYLFDEDLRGPIFVFLASYLPEEAKILYYTAAKKAGFISIKTYEQIMKALDHGQDDVITPVSPSISIEKSDIDVFEKPVSEKDEKTILAEIVGRLISNIENKHGCRITSGINSEKVTKLKTIQEHINQQAELKACSEEYQCRVREIMSICEMKRNPLHFWYTPDSVAEYKDLLNQHNIDAWPEHQSLKY